MTMNKLLLLICSCVLPIILGAEDRLPTSGNAAEPLPIRFIRRTVSDRPVLYEEEIKFFSELSLHSFAILSELGYVDQAGKWQKPRPKYSPLLELIRMNRKKLWDEDVEEMDYFDGEVRWYRNGREGKLLFGKLSCIILKSARGGGRTVVIFMHDTEVNRKMDFPITVNGRDAAEMLGFTYKNGVPQLEHDALQRLKTHLNNLE